MSSGPPRLTIKEALAQVLDAPGKTIIDVGCGDGAIVRHFLRLGATATGIEISEAQLERARAKAEVQDNYKVGRAENLPFPNAAADAVLYLNSLHHVPEDAMGVALTEAARVLRAGGRLIVVEPLASGSYFGAMRPIEDETAIRAAAYATLQKPPPGLAPESELIYESIIRLRDADHFLEAVAAPDPARRERLPLVEKELRLRFETYAQADPEGLFFISPMRRNTFLRTDSSG